MNIFYLLYPSFSGSKMKEYMLKVGAGEMQVFNLSTQKTEGGKFLWLPGQPRLYIARYIWYVCIYMHYIIYIHTNQCLTCMSYNALLFLNFSFSFCEGNKIAINHERIDDIFFLKILTLIIFITTKY